MALFNFGSKKESKNCCSDTSSQEIKTTCACGGSCALSDVKDARFIVLGACCKKSSDTFDNTKAALIEMGLNDQALNIGDPVEIAKYGVMQTPALVIDSKVVSYGKMLSVKEIKALIEKASK